MGMEKELQTQQEPEREDHPEQELETGKEVR
jgi:hypothetical protein